MQEAEQRWLELQDPQCQQDLQCLHQENRLALLEGEPEEIRNNFPKKWLK